MSGSGNSVLSLAFILPLAIELPLLAFHMSVLGCILRQQRKGNAAFRSGFFIIYAIQSVADYGNYSLGNIASFLITYACAVEFVAHVAIALNRFFVLTDSWNQRKLKAVLISIFLVPLPHAAFRFVGAWKLVETKVPGVYAVVREIPWVNTVT
ncbi:hypothetical protein AAVH_14572 [Aphelenchoides avenae]|nr:hypothetical protein AAVH_14572 [Aphelenchus avenae]